MSNASAEANRSDEIRRVAAAGIAFIALLAMSRPGGTRWVVTVLFAVFVAIAAVWLNRQYADSLDDDRAHLPARDWFFLLGLAIGLLVVNDQVHRHGPVWPLRILAIVFAIFAAATAVWLSRQYIRGLGDGRTLLPARDWFWLFAVFGVATVALYLWPMIAVRVEDPATPWSGLGLFGVFGIYLLFGDAVAGWRRSPSSRRATVLLISAVALLTAGAAGLRWGMGWQLWVSAALIALALLGFGPIGIALLSETSITPLVAQSRRRTIVFAVSGLVVLATTVILARVAVGSSIVFWPLAALTVLVVAVASATQADVVIVMSLVALMGLTPVQERLPDPVEGAAGRGELLALGDSYMSGEGAGVYYEGTDEADGNKCRQAPTAWAVLVSQSPQFGGYRTLACSGARTEHVRLHPPKKARKDGLTVDTETPAVGPRTEGTETQLQTYHANPSVPPPAMVVVSIGGNDAGFSTVGIMCVAPGECQKQTEMWRPLSQVQNNLRATYADIHTLFPQSPVVVIPYPDPIMMVPKCDDVALSSTEVAHLHSFITQDQGLNGIIKSTAEEYGFYYAPMESALADNHLQLCDPKNQDRPGLNFIGLRSVSGSADDRFNPANWTHNSLHPNERGHAAMARAFQTWLAAATPVDKDWPDPRAAVPEAAASRLTGWRERPDRNTEIADRPCEFDEVQSSAVCKSEGFRWAVNQVGDMLLPRGVLAIIGTVAGAWALAIALFAWRRRAHLAKKPNGRAPQPPPGHRGRYW
jgi:lysophospholipase L1-like esterase